MRDTPSWSETMVYDVEFKSVNQLMSTQVPVARHWIAQNVQMHAPIGEGLCACFLLLRARVSACFLPHAALPAVHGL